MAVNIGEEEKKKLARKWNYTDVLGAAEGGGGAGNHPRSRHIVNSGWHIPGPKQQNSSVHDSVALHANVWHIGFWKILFTTKKEKSCCELVFCTPRIFFYLCIQLGSFGCSACLTALKQISALQVITSTPTVCVHRFDFRRSRACGLFLSLDNILVICNNKCVLMGKVLLSGL